jgi:hypothetical protein
MNRQISTYYSELKESPSIVISWEPYILEKMIKFIQSKKNRISNDSVLMAIENPDYNYPQNIDHVEYWKSLYAYDELEKLHEICTLEFKKRTNSYIKKPKTEDPELTAARVALIIYYKEEGKYIFQNIGQNKDEYFIEQIKNIAGNRLKHNQVKNYYNRIIKKTDIPEKSKYQNPMTRKNIEKILPFLKDFPKSKTLAENDLNSFEDNN